MHEEMIHCPWRPQAPLRVELCGISYCDGSYRIRRRNSRFTVFEYITRGKGTLEIGDRVFVPEKGDVYFVTEGSDHEYRADPVDPWTKIWFNTSGPLPLTLLDTYGLHGVHHVPNVGAENIFREAYEACREDPALAEQIVAIALHRIIVELAAAFRSRQESTFRQSQELRDHLDRCVSDTPGLAEMARIMGCSPSQTIRVFKRDWGLTPYQYLIDRKLQKARTLLNGSAKSIKEISFELGFNSEYHFSALFKQKIGMSPKAFRSAP